MIYVNEIDPYCAQWLQNLMDAGVLPPGHIDTRSIEDVTPNDLAGYTQCHFFAGLGGWIYALDLAGWPRDRPVWTGSCPCQPFSAAGKGAGFADERHLWPAWQHLIAQRKPATVFGEQVASKDADPWIDLVQADMEGMGYAFGCVPFPSAGVGAPHIRDRNYWLGVGLADADNAGLEGRVFPIASPTERPAWPGCLVGGMAYADGGNAGAERQQRSGQQRQQQADSGIERMGDADRATGERRAGGVSGAQAAIDYARELYGREHHGSANASESLVERTSPLHGFWRDADWLGCTDGKWRPVEPGTFPLAHGIPGRVGRLRAYGNAINPWQAAEFVAAFMGQQALCSMP